MKDCRTCKKWNDIFKECILKDTFEPCDYEPEEEFYD